MTQVLPLVHLQVDGPLQRRAHVLEPVDDDAFGTHRAGDAGEALVVQLAGDEAAVVEVDLVLLLRAPLAVVEHHRRHRDVVAHAGHDLAHAHAPGAVAGIADGRAVRRRHLGADDGRQGVAAVAEAHRREEAARPLEAQVAVRHAVDVADVGGHHHVAPAWPFPARAAPGAGAASRGRRHRLRPWPLRSCPGCRRRARGSSRPAPSPMRPSLRRSSRRARRGWRRSPACAAPAAPAARRRRPWRRRRCPRRSSSPGPASCGRRRSARSWRSSASSPCRTAAACRRARAASPARSPRRPATISFMPALLPW